MTDHEVLFPRSTVPSLGTSLVPADGLGVDASPGATDERFRAAVEVARNAFVADLRKVVPLDETQISAVMTGFDAAAMEITTATLLRKTAFAAERAADPAPRAPRRRREATADHGRSARQSATLLRPPA